MGGKYLPTSDILNFINVWKASSFNFSGLEEPKKRTAGSAC